ncbi:MAG: transglycosylase SLT domain-containing protein [Betaproteobacteria bacterium]|nr:transglycosylase SLT domain-containing protein [Betaproteobacteria bacterium]
MRIGSINPGGLQVGPVALWSRRFVSVLALFASVAALVLIVESQYGQRPFGESLQGPLDAISRASHADAKRGQPAVLSRTEESRHRALSEFVARRYRVSQEVAFDLVGLAHRVGQDLQLDPLLIIAVIAVESSFNPIAESVAGAKGLMQIIPKFHGDKLGVYGGEQAVFDPATNIQVGARILKEYIRLTGNVGIALQMYAGALNDNDDQYTSKVLGVKQRLHYVASQSPGRPAPQPAVRTASARSSNAFALPLD